ncbi:histidine kinase [Brevibacterium aurantiacum]|uniref:histidine kinase n=1 Tax=Brevibacterium aurantiacum TaxID=273384 RepID=UPI000050FF2B|nr:histidine kinase [Brevibacterium aurantiacum]
MPWPTSLTARIPRESRMFVTRWATSVLGILWGVALCLPLLLAAVPSSTSRLSRRVLGWERSRQAKCFGIVMGQLPVRRGFFVLTGALAGIIAVPMLNLLTGFLLVTIGSLIQGLFIGGSITIGFDFWTISQPTLFVGVLYGAANLIGVIILAEVANWLHGIIDARFTQVSRPNAPHTRITQLLMTRHGVVMAIDEERRRIERDLHDGVQQNVVSLSVLIARAQRAKDQDKASALLDDALVQSKDLIDEMREVAWRVYPTALDEHGLGTVLNRVADHCPIPVELTAVPSRRVPQATESAAYFVVREAVTNVVKHANATSIRISVIDEEQALIAEVVDDGSGGADPTGGGLKGLNRRVGALDGTLTVTSTETTGTTVRAEIPYV